MLETIQNKTQKIDWSGPIQVAIVAGIILGANLPFFFMHRSEIRAFEREMKDFHQKYMEETKDFHGRLCGIEERSRK